MENNLDLYLEQRPKMRTGDGLLWDVDTSFNPGTWIGGMIKWWSPGANHASLILDEFESITNHKYCLEALGKGIVLRQIGERLKHFHGSVYWLPANEQYKEWRAGVGSWALDRIGVDYDFGSIAINLFRRAPMGMSSLFCSEFLYGAWRWEALSRIMGTDDPVKLLEAWKSEDNRVFNFTKAPRPAGILKMGMWEEPVKIL